MELMLYQNDVIKTDKDMASRKQKIPEERGEENYHVNGEEEARAIVCRATACSLQGNQPRKGQGRGVWKDVVSNKR